MPFCALAMLGHFLLGLRLVRDERLDSVLLFKGVMRNRQQAKPLLVEVETSFQHFRARVFLRASRPTDNTFSQCRVAQTMDAL